MTGFKLFRHQFSFEWKMFWRNPASVFFSVGLPLVFLFLLGAVFGGGNDRDSTYGLLADQYATGRGYVPFRTTDIGSTSSSVWSKATDINLGAIKKRHGGIVPITAEEYQRVMFHFAGVGTDPDLKISTAVTTRCVAGKVALAVSVTNADSRAADVVITTPFGSKTVTGVQPGKTVTQTVSTRQGAVAAASVSVEGSASDASYSASTFYDARTCG